MIPNWMSTSPSNGQRWRFFCRSIWICAMVGASLGACAKPQTQQGPGQLTPVKRPPVQAIVALPVEAAAHPPAPEGNPFADAAFFVNPDYIAKVEATAAAHSDASAWLDEVRTVSTAVWLDRIDAIEQVPLALERAKAQNEDTGRAVAPVFVVYNLPNRDCAAKASAGELRTEEDGEARYRQEFIDPLARHFSAHPKQRAVVILEPDSLPNLVSNLGVEKCARSQEVYKNSVAYAIAQLSLPNVHIYVDAAHAGWLGWEANRRRMVEIYAEVLAMAGGSDRIRGFATNVSNYNPLHGDDGARLESSNPCSNELSYVQALGESLESAGIRGKGFVIDTSRNGQAGIRTRWGNWCNIRGAGLGERPQVSPAPLVDAYLWIKPPGESDGVAEPSAVRFDENCRSADAALGAPEAGEWFEDYFLQLAQNAKPPLGR